MVKFEHLDSVNTPAGQGELNKFLSDYSYVEGFHPTQSDVRAFVAVGSAPDQHKLPHICRWYTHILYFSESERSSWPGEKVASTKTETHTPKKEEPKKEEKVEEEVDLFGDDTEEDLKKKEQLKKAAENESAGKKKAAPIAKSNVVIDVKPWDDTTDMKLIEEKVRAIQQEGLEWKASGLKPVGYGIKKLQICCHIVDDLVSIDDICEKIQEFEDLVQSTDIASFQKL